MTALFHVTRGRGALGAALVVALVVTVATAVRVPGVRVVQRVSGATEPDFTNTGLSPVIGVSGEFLRARVGSRLLPAPRVPKTVATKPTPVRHPPPRPPSAGGQQAPSVSPDGGLLSGGAWDLHLAMAPDRAVAKPGELVTYTIEVSNQGQGGFGGFIRLEWHVPVNTFGAPHCPVDSELLCPIVAPLFVSPGVGANEPLGIHLNFFTGAISLKPGAAFRYRFAVRVSPVVPPNTVLENHAHLTVPGGGMTTGQAPPVAVEQQAGV